MAVTVRQRSEDRRKPALGRSVAEATVLGLVAALAGLAACTSPSASKSIEISARLAPGDSLFGSVEVHGLPRQALERTGPSLLLVQLAEPGDSSPDLPPVAGRFVVNGAILRFEPRYRLAAGLELRVTLRGDSNTTRSFLLPDAAPSASSTTVLGIYPSADTIPANHLRWYVEFSQPMREGEAERHVHLLDAAGHEVDDAFLLVSEELWDPTRRRLTVLFDPGRVKRGVRQNLESGAPLETGRDYTLRIDRDWRDGRGAMLASGREKRFHVSEPIRTRLDPAGWTINVPRVGTRDPMTIDFGRALDKALAERLILVRSGEDVVAGEVRLSRGERVWQLAPVRPWSAGEYEVLVSPQLEDPAANRVAHNFDRDRAQGEWQEGEAAEPVRLVFRPVPEGESPVGFRPAGLYILPPGPGSSVGRARD